MRRAALALALLLPAAPAAASHIPHGDPALPEVVSCGDREDFPLAALRGPRFYERRKTLPAVALRRFVREQRGFGPEFPLRGFRLLARGEREILFGTGHKRLVTVLLERRAGRWKHTKYGDCTLRPVSDDGLAAEWKLDPAAPPPGPGSTEIPILVNENECASGEPATGRIAEPRVFADAGRVVVSVFVRPVEGSAECPGNPDTPYTLRLAEPLGRRALLDGGSIPARKRFPR